MKIAIVGAQGRMGRTLIQAVLNHPQCELSGAVDQKGADIIGEDVATLVGLPNCGVAVSDDPLQVFLQSEAVIDFTRPEASVYYSELTAQARIVHVIGTTGFSESDEVKIKAAASHARIIKAGNMSLGVNLLATLVQKAAKALDPSFDIEIVEMHHKHKVDAPSGTALLLGEAAADGRKINLSDNSIMTREGHTGPRPEGDIGFATLRGGSVIGDHSVVLAGPSERIVLSHYAQDRSIFAHGALKAALWAENKSPGLYSMIDVLGLSD